MGGWISRTFETIILINPLLLFKQVLTLPLLQFFTRAWPHVLHPRSFFNGLNDIHKQKFKNRAGRKSKNIKCHFVFLSTFFLTFLCFSLTMGVNLSFHKLIIQFTCWFNCSLLITHTHKSSPTAPFFFFRFFVYKRSESFIRLNESVLHDKRRAVGWDSIGIRSRWGTSNDDDDGGAAADGRSAWHRAAAVSDEDIWNGGWPKYKWSSFLEQGRC